MPQVEMTVEEHNAYIKDIERRQFNEARKLARRQEKAEILEKYKTEVDRRVTEIMSS